eukprot:5747704-Amphidinium_carterae.1
MLVTATVWFADVPVPEPVPCHISRTMLGEEVSELSATQPLERSVKSSGVDAVEVLCDVNLSDKRVEMPNSPFLARLQRIQVMSIPLGVQVYQHFCQQLPG